MAAPQTIRELMIKLGVIDDTKKVVKFDRALSVVKGTMVAVTGIAVAAAAAIGGVVFATANAGDMAAKTAKQIGMTAEQFQEYAKAADLGGASAEEFTVGARTLARNVQLAAEGSKEAAIALQGINLKDQAGGLNSTSVLIDQVADKIAGMTNETEKVALAQRIFGRSGGKLLPMLEAGSAGIKAMRMEARALGIVMSEEATKNSEEFVDRLADARDIVIGLRNRIGMGLMPTMTRMLSGFKEWFLANREVIGQRIDKAVEFIRDRMLDFRDALVKTNDFINTHVGGWENVFRQLGKVIALAGAAKGIQVLISLFTVLKGVGVAAMASISAAGGPVTIAIGLLVLAIVGALLVLDDFLTFMRGGESVIGGFLGAFEQSDEVRQQITELGESVMALATTLGTVLMPVVKAALSLFMPYIPTLEGMILLFKVLDVVAIGAIGALRAELTMLKNGVDLVTLAITDFGEFTKTVMRSVLDEIEPILAAYERLLVNTAGFRKAMAMVAPGVGLVEGGTGVARNVVNGLRRGAGSGQSFGGANRPGATTRQGDVITIVGTGLDSTRVADILDRKWLTETRTANLATGGAR